MTALRRRDDVTIETFDSDAAATLLPQKIQGADVVYHLAGVNRPQDDAEFQEVNFGLTEQIIQQASAADTQPKIVFTSSTQADRDNAYGRSKLAAEQALLDANQNGNVPVTIYRLPGVFGKWSRPNYNTVVATFCHNIARGQPITISDASHELELVYIDDVVRHLLTHLDSDAGSVNASIDRTFHVTLGDLAQRIREIHDARESLKMPDLSDELNQCLYPTYLSFLDEDKFSYPANMRTDDRGWLFELIKSSSFGQIFVSTTHPGITRGNHYHDSKVEKFCLIQGQGVIRFRDIDSDEIIDYPVDDQQIRIVDIPPGYTHSIENVGDQQMIVLFWVNQIFDPNQPDTYYDEVIQ